jgi:hypothetical protein
MAIHIETEVSGKNMHSCVFKSQNKNSNPRYVKQVTTLEISLLFAIGLTTTKCRDIADLR